MQGFGTQWSLWCTQAWNICLAIMNQVAFPRIWTASAFPPSLWRHRMMVHGTVGKPSIKVANTSKIDKFEWFIARRLEMAPSDCNHFEHTMPCEIIHQMVCGTSVNSLALILKTINLFLPCKLIFWKSYQSWYTSKFSKAHISVVGNPSTTILCKIIITPTLNIFLKTLHILHKRHLNW